MLRATPFVQHSVTKRIQPLRMRLSSVFAETRARQQPVVMQCSTRLLFHLAHSDAQLQHLSPEHMVRTVNATVACAAEALPKNKRVVTQSVIGRLLRLSHLPVTHRAVRKHLATASARDRNHHNLVSTLAPEKKKKQKLRGGDGGAVVGGGRIGSFYDTMTREWDLCSDIDSMDRRVCTIFTLISTFGFKQTYSADEIAQAKRRVSGKSARYIRTFGYAATREFYCRRRLITDGALHSIMRSGEMKDVRRAAWILFFDSSFQRFPKRPKKAPVPEMYDLWTHWLKTPTARSLPFVPRFVALLTHPRLSKMLAEAQKTGDAKMAATVSKNKALFKHRQTRALQVPPLSYDAAREMEKKKLSLDALAHRLQKLRQDSRELSALPTYVAVLRTSRPYRAPANARLLLQAHSDASDRGFSYASSEL